MTTDPAPQAPPSTAATTPRRMRPRRAPARRPQRRCQGLPRRAPRGRRDAVRECRAAPPRGDPPSATRRSRARDGRAGGEPPSPLRAQPVVVFMQPALCFGRKLCGRAEVDPVGMQRIAGVTVTDARSAKDATQAAHDHSDLCRRVARRIVGPDDVCEAFDRHRTSLRDAEHPQARDVPSCCRAHVPQHHRPKPRR